MLSQLFRETAVELPKGAPGRALLVGLRLARSAGPQGVCQGFACQHVHLKEPLTNRLT